LNGASDFEASSTAIASLVDKSSALASPCEDKAPLHVPAGSLPLFDGLSKGE
jgi:hypothetical protein